VHSVGSATQKAAAKKFAAEASPARRVFHAEHQVPQLTVWLIAKALRCVGLSEYFLGEIGATKFMEVSLRRCAHPTAIIPLIESAPAHE
jgi:hypothetical protein